MPQGENESSKTDEAQRQPDAPDLRSPIIPIPPQNPPQGSAQQDDPDPKPNEAQAVRRELHWLEVLNFCGQIVLAVVGIIAACIYGRQLSVMRGTLAEMKRSGEQSTEQVWSAILNLNWMARSADWSQKEVQRGIEASGKQSRDQLSFAQTQLAISERPWIAASAQRTRFYWDRTPDGAMLDFKYKITIENFGNLPASNVYVIYDEAPIPKPKRADWWDALMKEQEDYCASRTEELRRTSQGITVFPRQQHTFDETGPPLQYRRQKDWIEDMDIQVHIRGCVVYRSPSSKKMLQTGFFYTVLRKDTTWGRHLFYGDSFEQTYLQDSSGGTKSD
jgi:hypothetical protein